MHEKDTAMLEKVPLTNSIVQLKIVPSAANCCARKQNTNW